MEGPVTSLGRRRKECGQAEVRVWGDTKRFNLGCHELVTHFLTFAIQVDWIRTRLSSAGYGPAELKKAEPSRQSPTTHPRRCSRSLMELSQRSRSDARPVTSCSALLSLRSVSWEWDWSKNIHEIKGSNKENQNKVAYFGLSTESLLLWDVGIILSLQARVVRRNTLWYALSSTTTQLLCITCSQSIIFRVGSRNDSLGNALELVSSWFEQGLFLGKSVGCHFHCCALWSNLQCKSWFRYTVILDWELATDLSVDVTVLLHGQHPHWKSFGGSGHLGYVTIVK